MRGFIVDLENETLKNDFFRKVLYTGKNSQLVLMSIEPEDEIGEEIHHLDQFIRVEAGEGVAIIDGVEHKLTEGFAVVIPAGAKHNVINISKSEKLKLYSVYSPAEHKDKTIHKTRAEAIANEEHFDGVTTE